MEKKMGTHFRENEMWSINLVSCSFTSSNNKLTTKRKRKKEKNCMDSQVKDINYNVETKQSSISIMYQHTSLNVTLLISSPLERQPTVNNKKHQKYKHF